MLNAMTMRWSRALHGRQGVPAQEPAPARAAKQPPTGGATKAPASGAKSDTLSLSADRNGDGGLTLDEITYSPAALRRFLKLDRDGDGRLTQDELGAASRRRTDCWPDAGQPQAQPERPRRRREQASEAPAPEASTAPEAPAAPPVFGYTTLNAHPAWELAAQLGAEPDALLAANGWTDPEQVIPGGTAVQVPDTPTTRANATAFGGAITETTARPAGAPEEARPAPAAGATTAVDPATGLTPDEQAAIAGLTPERLAALGQSDPAAFFEALRPAAEAAERLYGVPAAVTLAQAALESGYGQNGIGGYNIFGIKGQGPAGSVDMPAWEVFNGQDVTVNATFALFNNYGEAILEHAKLFHNGYYDQAMAQYTQDHDPVAFGYNITGIYATDPAYGDKLARIIDQFGLDRPVAPAPAATAVTEQAPADDAWGAQVVDAGRGLQADGYVYPPDLGPNYYHDRFKVGCCADFACDAWTKAGVDVYQEMVDGGFNPHYTPSQVKFFQQSTTHSWHGADEPAQVGDMVFFKWASDASGDPVSHVAIVTAVGPDGKPSAIIESSTFNSPVREREVDPDSAASIVGYGRV